MHESMHRLTTILCKTYSKKKRKKIANNPACQNLNTILLMRSQDNTNKSHLLEDLLDDLPGYKQTSQQPNEVLTARLKELERKKRKETQQKHLSHETPTLFSLFSSKC